MWCRVNASHSTHSAHSVFLPIDPVLPALTSVNRSQNVFLVSSVCSNNTLELAFIDEVFNSVHLLPKGIVNTAFAAVLKSVWDRTRELGLSILFSLRITWVNCFECCSWNIHDHWLPVLTLRWSYDRFFQSVPSSNITSSASMHLLISPKILTFAPKFMLNSCSVCRWMPDTPISSIW